MINVDREHASWPANREELRMRAKTALVALAILSTARPVVSQQHQLATSWGSGATEFRGQNDRRVTVICPPRGEPSDVWGTDVYTDDSSVCSAAVHAGVITIEEGGVVTFVVAPGMRAYEGSTRNGVTSKSFNGWEGSFRFDRDREGGQIEWRTTAQGLDLVRRPVTVTCPPGGTERSIWGSDQYTDDSSICTAAVHSGAITFADGGTITIEPAGVLPEYTASVRSDVTSRAYRGTHPAFRVSTLRQTATLGPGGRAPLAPRPPREQPAEVKPTQDIVTGSLSVVGRALEPARSITTASLQITGRALQAERAIITPPLVVEGTATTN
jgi:hypothetical protein